MKRLKFQSSVGPGRRVVASARPGDGRGRWLSVARASEVLGLVPARVVALAAEGVLPGAYRDEGWPLGWRFGRRELGALFGSGVARGLGRLQCWLDLDGLARLLGCHKRTLSRAIEAGSLRAHRLTVGSADLGWRVPECEYWRLVGMPRRLTLAGLAIGEDAETGRCGDGEPLDLATLEVRDG